MTKFKMLQRYFATNILYMCVLLSSICVACDEDHTQDSDSDSEPQVATDITTKITPEKNDLKVSVKVKVSDFGEYQTWDRSVIVKYRLPEDEDWMEEKTAVKNTKLTIEAECVLKKLAPETEYIVQAICIISNAEFPDEPKKSTTLVRHYSLYDIYPYSGEPVGVVWQVFNNGLNGRMLSLDEGYEKWSTESILTEAQSPYGQENMARIKAIDPTFKKYPAFKWCADKGEGWYFLAKETFDVDIWAMNAALERIGKTPITNGNNSYWTSRESNNTEAWPNLWNEGGINPKSKSSLSRVRACKEF